MRKRIGEIPNGKWQRCGSLTIEASFLVPMILFCMAAVMISGMNRAGDLAQEMHAQRETWIGEREELPQFPLLLRGGSEAQELVDRIRQG